MAAQDLDLIIDIQRGKLLRSFDSTAESRLPDFYLSDTIPASVRLVKSSGLSSRPWSDVDLTGKTIRLAIGNPAGRPTGGTYTLTYSGNTTAALSYNATESQISVAVNALASIISAGGVVVTASASGAYRIAFSSVGARTAITANTASLYPSSGAFIAIAQTGDASTREVAVVRLETQPAAYSELTTTLPVAAITSSVIRVGSTGVGAIQSFTLDPTPYAGTYALEIDDETTGAIPYDASAATVQAAIVALTGIGAGGVTVAGASPTFTLSFAASLGAVETVSGDATGLSVATGYSGDLSLNTAAASELLNGEASASATLEIELYDDGDAVARTVYQSACTLRDDVIGNTPSAETGGPAYMTAAGIIDARKVNLSIYNYSGAAVTFNGVSCPDEATTAVGLVDPWGVTYVAASGGSILGQSDGEVDCAWASGTSIGTGGTLALPAVTHPGSTVTLSLGGA